MVEINQSNPHAFIDISQTNNWNIPPTPKNPENNSIYNYLLFTNKHDQNL